MKLITCIIRPERLPEVKTALFRAGVTGITISRVTGHGGERDVVEVYLASSVVLEFREKIKIEMVCSEPFVQPTIDAILASARTGEVGDGKIFVLDVTQVYRIRTGERNEAAVTPAEVEHATE
ncbi:MAG: P-II family nitrogen regulator [Candidatus Rokuibacteriota bacterium]